MKHIVTIKSAVFAAILSTAFLGCGGVEQKFSATDFKQSLSWVNGLASNLDRVARQRNSIVLKDAFDSATQQVKNTITIGTKVSWRLHVRSVNKDGIDFKEDTYNIVRSPDNCIEVHFNPNPQVSPGQLRTMSSGDTVTVHGTISDVSVSQAMMVRVTLTDVTIN